MNKLTDATVFSHTYQITFDKAVSKPCLAKLAKQLILDIGRPLSHNDIIVGHIKALAKLSSEEFIFISLTRLETVDLKFSAQWTADLTRQYNSISLDINVLVFGYSQTAITEVVDRSLAVLRRVNLC